MGAASQGSQTFTMNVTNLPAGGVNVRVYKTTANGSDFFGNPVTLTLGSNSITVSLVLIEQLSSNFQVEMLNLIYLTLNGATGGSSCISIPPPPTTSLIGCVWRLCFWS